MSTISNLLPVPPDNFSTTLNGSISAAALSIALNSVTGLPTEGVGVIYKKESDGTVDADTVEFIHWTNISGSTLQLTDSGDRGVSGSANGAQTHDSSDTFEVWVHANSHYKGIRTAVLAEHNDSGTHKANIALTTPTLTSPVFAGTPTGVFTGWIGYSTVIPTRQSSDDPTYVLRFAGVDLTDRIAVGMKVKLTQASIERYGIVTAISFSTNTDVTVLTRCDDTSVNYDVLDTASNTISGFAYSPVKNPVGFPMDPIKWSVRVINSSDYAQNSPSAGTWYNLNSSLKIDIPIGSWRVSYRVNMMSFISGSGYHTPRAALSTSTSSVSDQELNVGSEQNSTDYLLHLIGREKDLLLASKATYYLIQSVDGAGVTNIQHLGSRSRTIMEAVCNYL